MAKAKKKYVCQDCGSISYRWQGQCPDCGEWNTLTEEAGETVFAAKHNLQTGGREVRLVGLDSDIALPDRKQTGIAEFDRAVGGGLVAGSATLMGGDPGIGKSTLLLQVSARLADLGLSVAYISGEEAADQVRLRARRLGLGTSPVQLASATSVRDILTTLRGDAPDFVVIDSIQTMHSDLIEGAPGTVSQVRASAQELIKFAKEHGTMLMLVGHVTKDGNIAGPRVLEHMVDTVMSFEGERSHQYRILRSIKNRFGGTDEIGGFRHGGKRPDRGAKSVSAFPDRSQRGSDGGNSLPGAGRHQTGAGGDSGPDSPAGQRGHSAQVGCWLGQFAAGDDSGGTGSTLRAKLFGSGSISEHRRRLSPDGSGS